MAILHEIQFETIKYDTLPFQYSIKFGICMGKRNIFNTYALKNLSDVVCLFVYVCIDLINRRYVRGMFNITFVILFAYACIFESFLFRKFRWEM